MDRGNAKQETSPPRVSPPARIQSPQGWSPAGTGMYSRSGRVETRSYKTFTSATGARRPCVVSGAAAPPAVPPKAARPLISNGAALDQTLQPGHWARSSTTSTGGRSASSSRIPTTRSSLRPSGIASPGRQVCTAVSNVAGSAGVPPSSSSLNRNPAIRFSPSVFGWGRTAWRAYDSHGRERDSNVRDPLAQPKACGPVYSLAHQSRWAIDVFARSLPEIGRAASGAQAFGGPGRAEKGPLEPCPTRAQTPRNRGMERRCAPSCRSPKVTG